MRKLFISLTALFFSLNLWSMNFSNVNSLVGLQWTAQNTGLNFRVGDFTDHSLNMGFIQGSNHTSIRSVGQEGTWIVQDMDLGFFGKQKVEILMDQNTGEIKKLLVNGKEEQIPDQSGSEVISAEESKITVPAGTFDAIHLKIKDKEGKVSEAWINPDAVPVFGSIKMVSPSQMGEVVTELTGFGRGN